MKLNNVQKKKNFFFNLVTLKDELRTNILEKEWAGTVVYLNKSVTINGCKYVFTNLVNKTDEIVNNGIVTDSTHIIFRS